MMSVKQIIYLVGFIFLASLSRLIPHLWNFTAVGALTLLAAREFKELKWALLVPLASLLVGDLFLGFHKTMFFTYGAMVLIGLLSWWARSLLSGMGLAGASLLSSLIFFGITNFGVWFLGGLYSSTWEGLAHCYVMGLPFLKGQLMGDLFFTGVVFFAWDRVKKFNGWSFLIPY